MLGLLLRLLPFWVREPLFIVIGSVLGVRLTYLAVRDHDLAPAGFGALFLVFTAIRVHAVVRALRARRKPGLASAGDGAAAPGAASTPAPAAARAEFTAVPRPGTDTPVKEPNAWGQALAAVAVFGAIAAALWLGPRVLPAGDSTHRAASCPGADPEKLPKAYAQTPEAVTGEDLCTALDRSDLAQLLGTPTETATTASGTDGTAPLTDGRVALPEAEIAFDTYTVHLSATYDKLTTAQYVKLMKFGDEQNVRTLTVLGRPAVLSSDHTMKVEINLGSGGSTGGPVQEGPLARTLSVALDRKDRGGYYDLTVWSRSGSLPDDGVLLGIAEKVLPAIPRHPVR